MEQNDQQKRLIVLLVIKHKQWQRTIQSMSDCSFDYKTQTMTTNNEFE